MTETHSGLRTAGLLAAMALTAACGAVTTGSYVATGTNLGGYATYGWGEIGEAATGDPRLDANPFFFDRVRARVDEGLEARGFAAAEATPDLVVHVHTSVTQDIDTSLIDQEFCAESACRPFVYDSGTLVVDLVDPSTSRLVWRGWAESTFGEVINDQAAMERRIDVSVSEILARLPGRP